MFSCMFIQEGEADAHAFRWWCGPQVSLEIIDFCRISEADELEHKCLAWNLLGSSHGAACTMGGVEQDIAAVEEQEDELEARGFGLLTGGNVI